MTPEDLNQIVIDKALAALPREMDTPDARVLLIAIAMQEAGAPLSRRVQMNGPARGLWQFETGGIRGVLTHPKVARYAVNCAFEAGATPTVDSVYSLLAADDILACQFARLLLYTDIHPMPGLDDATAGWDYYIRNWRPGKPRPNDWPQNHQRARDALSQKDTKS